MKKTAGSSGTEARYVHATTGQKDATQKMPESPCPYCLNPRLFEEVLATKANKVNVAPLPQRLGAQWRVTPQFDADWSWHGVAGTPSTRGKFWLITYAGEEFVERLKDFTAYMIGQQMPRRRYNEPGPFLCSTIDRLKPSDPWRFGLYFAARITHPRTEVAVDFHWWPTHERTVTLRNVPDEGATPGDLKIVSEALKFVRVETRGRPGGFEEIELIKAIQEQGEQVTQKGVAKVLGTSDRTIREWLAQRKQSWDEFLEEARHMEIV